LDLPTCADCGQPCGRRRPSVWCNHTDLAAVAIVGQIAAKLADR
jgi:hypothetical protein